MKIQPFYMLILIALFSAQCSKDNGPQIDKDAPEIHIFSPSENDFFAPGSTIGLEAEITENLELHSYNVVLRSQSGDTAITLDGGHLHTKKHLITKRFQLPDQAGQEYQLTIKASDHDDNQSSNSVNFYTKD